MIDLTWLAAPLGLVGLAIALVLWRRNRSASHAELPSSVGASGSAQLVLRQYPLIAGLAILLGALLWVSVALPTAVAFVAGALLTMAAAAFALQAVDDARPVLGNTVEGHPRRTLAMALAVGIAVASVGLLGLGALYFTLIHAPAAFLPSELVDFGNIAGGLALGASVVALLLGVVGGTFAGAAGAFGLPVIRTAEGRQTPKGDIRRVGATGSAAASAAELLQSYLCASVAAIVIAGAGRHFSGQRVEAVALPILIGSIGLICSLVAVAAARLFRSSSPAALLRALGLIATALFLVLAYLVVVALEMEGQDPFTGRQYLLSGPFWAILAGALAAVACGFASEFYTSWRPARRLAEGSGLGLGQTILWAFSLGMESVVIPTLLIGATTVVAFYFAGTYGIALAAVAMLSTVAITVGTAAFGPLAGSFELEGDSSGRRGPRPAAVGLGAIAESAEAIAKGVSVAAAGMTSLALLAGYTYATGLWAVGIDLQSPLLIAGLLVGAALPIVTAALLLGGGRRAISGVGAAPSATGTGAEGAHQADSNGLAQSTGLPRKMILPLLIPVALPPLFAYGLGVQSVAGLIAGGAISSLLLGLFLANSGSALVSASIFVAANATAAEVHHVGAGSGDFGRALRDGCVTAVTTVVKLVGILSIVLVPWFIRIL